MSLSTSNSISSDYFPKIIHSKFCLIIIGASGCKCSCPDWKQFFFSLTMKEDWKVVLQILSTHNYVVLIYNEYEKWKILRKVANELEKVWLGWIWQEGKSRKTEVLENAVGGN